MSIAQHVEVFSLKELSKLSGRPRKTILADVKTGKLKGCVVTGLVAGDDHLQRHLRSEGFDVDNYRCAEARIVWLDPADAATLIDSGEVLLKSANYPRFIDSTPTVRRYKRELLVFDEPHTSTLDDLCFLDGDAIHYIAKHTDKTLASADDLQALPKLGHSSIVYRLLAVETPAALEAVPAAVPAIEVSAPDEWTGCATACVFGQGPLSIPSAPSSPGWVQRIFK